MIRYFLYLFLPLSLFLSGCQTKEEVLVTADITVEELMERMKDATDPKRLCEKASSYVLRQKMTKEGDYKNDFDVEIKYQKDPYFTKTTIFNRDVPTSITIFNGNTAWSIDPVSGNSKPLTGDRMKLVRGLAKIGNPAYSYTDIFQKLGLKEIVSGTTEYYKLICYPKGDGMTPMLVYINKNSFLTKKLSLKMIKKEFVLLDYTSFINEYAEYNGVKMPKITTVLANDIKYRYKIKKFELNVKFKDKEFELPVPWYNKQVMEDLKKARKEAKKEELKQLKKDK